MNRWVRVLLAVLALGMAVPLVEAPELAAAAPAAPVQADPSPIQPDGQCGFNGPPNLVLIIGGCADEAAWLLWNIKDPVFWQMAYVGGRELLAGVLNPKSDGLYGCSYPGHFDDPGFPLGPEDYGPFNTCVARVEREALEQAYVYSTESERIALCREVWLSNCQVSQVYSEDEQAAANQLLCGIFPNWPQCAGVPQSVEDWLESAEFPTPDLSGGYSVLRSNLLGLETVRWVMTLDIDGIAVCPVVTTRSGCLVAGGRYATERGAYVSVNPLEPSGEGLRRFRIYGGFKFASASSADGSNTRVVTVPEGVDVVHLVVESVIGSDSTFRVSWAFGEGLGSTGEMTSGSHSNSSMDTMREVLGLLPLVHDEVTSGESGSGASGAVVFPDEVVRGVRVWYGAGAPAWADLVEHVQSAPVEVEWPDQYVGDPGTDPFPEPDELPAAPPAVPVPWTPPVEAPAPAPAPEPVPNPEVTPETGEQGWFDILGNRIGGFFDNLGSLIGGAFDWLGGLMTDLLNHLLNYLKELLEWVVQVLGDLLRAIEELLRNIWNVLRLIRNAIVDLGQGLAGLLGQIAAGIASMANAVVSGLTSLGTLITNLPSLIGAALKWVLMELFIPSTVSLPALGDACATSFPCSWVQEAVTAGGEMVSLLDVGGCSTPAFGFESGGGFDASLPAPAGCGGGNGEVDGDSGDLLGLRVPLRALFSLMLWLGVVGRLLGQLPWSRQGDNPLEGAA